MVQQPAHSPSQCRACVSRCVLTRLKMAPKHPADVVIEVALFAVAQIALYYGVRWAMTNADPEKRSTKLKSTQIFKRLGITGLTLNEYEHVIATEVIHPDDIHVGFNDIGGLDDVIESLKETVLYPLTYPQVYSSISPLLSPPKGVLLYGPPGCGKQYNKY